MADRSSKIPGRDHPITITPNPNRVTITYGGHIIAETRHALSLREASYPAVLYIPRADAKMASLTPSTNKTYCPYKGECSYYNLPGTEARAANAIWSYETPYDSVSAIKDHLAFYPDRVEITETP